MEERKSTIGEPEKVPDTNEFTCDPQAANGLNLIRGDSINGKTLLSHVSFFYKQGENLVIDTLP